MKDEVLLTLRGVNAEGFANLVVDKVCEKIVPLIVPQHQKDPEDRLTIREAAQYLRVSVSSIARYTRDGHLVSRGPEAGRRVLYRRGDLDDFVIAHRV